MYAQQKADIDAHEIRNSPRIQLLSIEGPYATEMQELNFERRRLISDHMQRTDALTHKFHCAVAAENSARLTAKASAEEARLAAEAQCMQAPDAIGHMKQGALAEEAGQAIGELRQQLETLAADSTRRDEDILNCKESQLYLNSSNP